MGFGIEEKKAIERVMEKGILSDYKGNWSDKFFGGEEIQALEKEWAEHVGVKHAIACNSATSALYASLGAIGIKAFEYFMNDKRLRGIPKIIETPKGKKGTDLDKINLKKLKDLVI